MRHGSPTRHASRRAAVLAALAGAAAWVGAATGSASGQPPGEAAPLGITGRDFAGLRLPLDVVRGPLTFKALRAGVWTEDELSGGPGVQRLLLSGDVQVRIGLYEFDAARASVWIERLEDPPTRPDSPGVYQVYVYFDRVGTPTAAAGVSVAADRLPVRAVIEPDAPITLDCAKPTPGRPADDFLRESERALAGTLRRIAGGTDAGAEGEDRASLFTAVTPRTPPTRVDPSTARPYRAAAEVDRDTAIGVARATSRLPFADENAPIFAAGGIVTVAPGRLTVYTEGPEPAIVASDGVIVQYLDPTTGRGLSLEAARAVVFLRPGAGPDEPTRLRSEAVRGVYLEGDVVASDGRYTIRGARVYYDLTRNKAILLDAVFWAYDEDRRLPLYVRAQTIRQESQQEFRAEKARLSTSEFFTPDFSIGADSVTIRRVPRAVASGGGIGEDPIRAGFAIRGTGRADDELLLTGSRITTVVDADDITLRAGDVPFLYFPGFSGDPGDVALKDIRFENSSGTGSAVKTRWNLNALLGFDTARGVEADLLAQYFFDRGPAAGIDASWDLTDSAGALFTYVLPDDDGLDLLKPGTKRSRTDETRAITMAEQRWTLDEKWELFAEGAYVSDETFVDAFFEELGESRREFTTRGVLTRREDNTLFSLAAKTQLNDFIANEWLLQSAGSSTEKLPEITYVRQSDSLMAESALGPIEWFQEWRAGRIGLNFDKPTARERGYDTTDLSTRALGIGPDDTIASWLRAQGLFEETVYRLDTRHEFVSRLDSGPVRLEPFVVARATHYDNDFAGFSAQETDNLRAWGAVGLRASTQLQRIDESANSRFFDISRLRHVIEPSATVWHAGTSVDRVDLPVYDEGVEGLTEGSALRLGVNQTWQTKRGGTRARHNADVFKLNTDLVFHSDDADRDSPIGRWNEARPELSNPGEYFVADGLWQVSDAVALTGSNVFDFEVGQAARSSAGVLIQQDPLFAAIAELRSINPLDSTYADLGLRYTLTPKYTLGARASYNLNDGGFQSTGLEVRRSFAAVVVGLNASYNNVTDETSFGFVVRPTALQKPRRTRILDTEPESAETGGSSGGRLGGLSGAGGRIR